jgi:putative hemolysin
MEESKYNSTPDKLAAIWSEIGVSLNVINDEELKHFPLSPFIAISRHLIGDLDYLLMLQILQTSGRASKVVTYGETNFSQQLGNDLVELKDRKARKEFYKLLDKKHKLNKHLDAGGAIGVFPAIENEELTEGRTFDKIWEPAVIKLIRDLQLPVVPISFQAADLKILKQLKAHLSNPLENKAPEKELIINVRIGTPISLQEIASFGRLARLSRFLRARTLALGTPIDVKQFYFPGSIKLDATQQIAPAIDNELISNEIAHVRESNLLFTQAEFEVLTARASQIPNTLLEIGRLREITFRTVDEGSNKPRDIDEYDLYYEQLIIWDKVANKLVGGYRIGRGDFIYQSYSAKGFYIASLFKFEKPFHPILEQSAELGRAYIVPEYQRKRLPLFLLWRGIMAFLLKNPQFKYLIGPLSISKMYSDISKQLIIEFVKKHYYNHELAQHVKPRKAYKVKIKNIDTDILIENFEGEIQKLDNFIEDIEPFHLRMPVLMKKYIKQNARIVCFNVDPKFSDTLDGLMILDIAELPSETLENLKTE